MSTIIVFLVLLIGFVLSYKTSRHGFFAPQVGMYLGFLAAVTYGLFYIQKWDLVLTFETSMLICGGVACYSLCSVSLQYFFKKMGVLRISSQYRNVEDVIEVERWKLIAFALMQLFIFWWLNNFLMGVTGISNLSSAIYHYRSGDWMNYYSTPLYISIFRGMSMASGHVFMYLLLHSAINGYKAKKILLIVNVFLSVLVDLTSGSRGHVVALFVASITQAYFIYVRKNGFNRRIDIKKVLKIILLTIGALFAFVNLGSFVGRKSSRLLSDSIAIYLSAPIKNLDIFVRRYDGNFTVQPIESNLTLKNFINQIAEYTGMEHLIHNDIIYGRYETVNGFWLGNVYTMFSNYLYDGGYLFVFIYIIIMSIITNAIYVIASKDKVIGKIDISVIFYGYVYFTIVFSVFSARFYSDIFSDFFMKIFLYWILLSIFLGKIRIKLKPRK